VKQEAPPLISWDLLRFRAY